jgi:hypothetical protein
MGCCLWWFRVADAGSVLFGARDLMSKQKGKKGDDQMR